MIGRHDFDVFVDDREQNPTIEPMPASLSEKDIGKRFISGFNESRCISGKLRNRFGPVSIEDPYRNAMRSEASRNPQANKISTKNNRSWPVLISLTHGLSFSC
jgi:hypothetical protein